MSQSPLDRVRGETALKKIATASGGRDKSQSPLDRVRGETEEKPKKTIKLPSLNPL